MVSMKLYREFFDNENAALGFNEIYANRIKIMMHIVQSQTALVMRCF